MVAELPKQQASQDQAQPAQTPANSATVSHKLLGNDQTKPVEAATAPDQSSALHSESHGPDALHHHRHMRHHGGHHGLHHVDIIGDEIKHDGSAQTYTTKPGDNLSTIAERQLPKGASLYEIYNQVKEIAKANGIADPDKIPSGMQLKLSAMTAAHAMPGQGAPEHVAPAPPGDGKTPTAPAPGADHSHPATPIGPGGDSRPQVPAAPIGPGSDVQPQSPATPPKPGDAPQTPTPTPDQVATDAKVTASALQNALGDDNPTPPPSFGEGAAMPVGPITDTRKVMELLATKSPEQIKAISAAFDQQYGKEHGGRSLEAVLEDRMTGLDKSKVTDIFHRSSVADDPGRVHTALQEMHQWFGGRSSDNCQKDIRDTLATMNAAQIQAFKTEYESRYGTKFDDDIAKDSKMSDETKAALKIYEKGSDNRTDADTLALADLATKAKSLDMFQEAFRGASAQARTEYMQQGGEAKMKEAFSGIFSDSDVQKAEDYVKEGKLDTVTKVQDNAGIFSANDTAIDNAITNMSQAQKDSYERGKALAATFPEYIQHGRSSTFNSDAYNKLTADQKTDYDQYRSLDQAMEKAGNQAKVMRWNDMIANGGETLVTKLAQHGGLFGSDKVDKALTDIEGMNKADFDRLKKDPNYRKELDAALALNYSGDDLKRAEALLDTKAAAQSYDNGGQTGGDRGVLQLVKDKESFWSNDSKGILSAVENMTPAEQQRYRTDAQFKKDLDSAVNNGVMGTEQEFTAERALQRVANGQSPQEDIIDKLHAHEFGSKDTPQMLSEVEAAFKQDPGLRDRLLHPKTDADKATAEQFQSLARECFGGAYDKYVEPLIKNGSIPFADRAELYKGFWSNNTKGLYDAIATATPAEQAAIAADPSKTLGFLTPEQQQLAGVIAGQHGQLKPEDQMRAAILGESGDKDLIKNLESLSPADRAKLINAYEQKFNTSLIANLDDKLSGQDRIDAERSFRDLPTSAREAFNLARDEDYTSNDGIGRAFVRNVWDGTSDMSTDDLNQYAAQMQSYSSVYKEMPAAQSAQMADNLTQAVDLYRKSKDAAADAAVDGAIIVAGVGGAAFTGGVSLGLIAATGLGGAALKVGAKAAIEGADYDTSQIGADALSGGVDAATMIVGPGEVAAILKIGGKAAATASELAIAEAGSIVEAGGKQILKDGAEATLSREMTRDVSTALAHGAKEVDAKTMQSLAEKYAADPADVPAVRDLLTRNLNKAIVEESSSALKNTAREIALNSGAGAAAGGTSGLIGGASEWDSSKSVSENLAAISERAAMGAGSGLIMGGGATVGFKALGKGFSAAREAIAAHMGDAHVLPTEAFTPAGDRVLVNESGRISEIPSKNPTFTAPTKVEYHQSGPLEGKPSQVTLPDGTRYQNTGDNQWLVTKPAYEHGATLHGDVAVTAHGDIKVTESGGDVRLIHSDGTSSVHKAGTNVDLILNDSGNVLVAKSANGEIGQFAYSKEGAFEGVQYASGRSVLTEDGGKSWIVKDSESANPVKFEGHVTVDDAGIVHLKPSEVGAPERVLRPDGSSSHIDAITGKPSDIVYRSGFKLEFQYAEDGSVSQYTNGDGLTWKRTIDPPSSGAGGENSSLASSFDGYDAAGNQKAFKIMDISVAADGTVTEISGAARIVEHTDGLWQTYLKDSGEHLRDVRPAGYESGEIARGADGRPLEDTQANRDYVHEKFKPIVGWDLSPALRSVETELKDVKAIGVDGKPTSAFDSLMREPSMTDAQKENILLNLAQVREHLALYRVGDSMHPDAEVNWIHTQGEMAKVLEVGRANHLTGNEMEDAMLASMYSDAVKFASPAPVGAKANFFTHHLDGALAAKESLTNQGFPPERIEGIVQAIRAHQLAPPRFMGEMYYGAVNRGIDAALKDRQINAVEAQHLRNVLENMSEIGADGKTRIKAIADVNNAPKVMGADGQMQVAFTPEEQKVLSYSGTDTWNVPYDPKADPNFKQMSKAEQAQALERQKISQTLIDADGIDNYSTSGGASKLFAISGPGTPYHDGQMWDVIDPSRSSFKDALPVMSPEAQKLAQASLASRDAFTNPQSGELKKELDQWIISQGRDPSKPIPYYNTDLKYPTSETLAPGERNYPGLNDQEMKDYLFAKEIREHAVELLRRDHRVEGDLPGRFFPATDDSQLNASRNNFGARSPEKLTIPGTNPENIKPGEHFTSPDKTISAYRNPDDGSLSVTDFSNNTFRRFDSENRLIESTAANTNREFHYNSNGQLNDVSTVNVATGEKTILSRTADGQGWVESYTDSSGKLTRVTRGESELLVDADGTVRRYGKVNGNEVLDRYNPDGSKDLVYPTGRIDYLRANYAKEKQALESSLSRDLADNPNRLARAQELIKQFEANAEDPERNLSTNDRALLYKQINRLLTDSTATAIPLVDRVNLAEQVLDHSAHPWHVDQGSNSTCNVTTLEHRNYWRNPDKNAQLIADVALDGKYTFASGQVVNMRDMSGELKPDFEAKRNLARQAEGAPLQKGSLKADGERDYSSQILETTMVNNRWNNSTETIDMQGRKLTQADTRMRYGANGEALGVVEHGHFHALYEQNGDLVSSYKPGEQYYDVDKKPLPAIPPERIVYDQNGVTEGFVDKTENLQQIYDARGNRLTKSPALYNEGVKVFDKDGHLYMAHTRPGDFHYEKVPTGPKGDGERVIVDLGGRKIELRDKHGDVQSSPSISAAELAGINKNVTGKTEPSFIIGSDHTVGGFEINVNSTDEMLAALRKMEAEHNLPAVMMVNTSKPPFDAPITYNKDGKFDGWHVVNVQGIKTVKDPVTGEERQMIRFTNQWGSKRDFLKDGVDAKTMFESMQRTPDKPPAPTPPPTPPSDNSSFWKRVKKWFT